MKKEKNVRILSAIRFICILQEIKKMGNLVSYRLSTVVVTRWAFLRQSVFTTIPLIKERLSGKSFKISIFTTTPLKWKSVFEATESFFEEDVTVDDVDIGYVGKSNNKRLIKTDQHVDDAYTSRFNHKHSELVIYIEEKERTSQGQKRKSSTTRNGTWIIFIYFHCCCLMSLLLLS